MAAARGAVAPDAFRAEGTKSRGPKNCGALRRVAMGKKPAAGRWARSLQPGDGQEACSRAMGKKPAAGGAVDFKTLFN